MSTRTMKTTTAIHIAEIIWDNSVGPSFMEILTMFGFDWQHPDSVHNHQIMHQHGPELKGELIAKWANIIMEHDHDEDQGHSISSNG